MTTTAATHLDGAQRELEGQVSRRESHNPSPIANTSKTISSESLPITRDMCPIHSHEIKSVRFSNVLKVILIPTRNEIFNKYDLFWDMEETRLFREEAIRDIDTYVQLHSVSPDEAQWQLYQPDYEKLDTSTQLKGPHWITNDITHGRLITRSPTDEKPQLEITLIEHNCQLNCDTCKLPCLFGINETFW